MKKKTPAEREADEILRESQKRSLVCRGPAPCEMCGYPSRWPLHEGLCWGCRHALGINGSLAAADDTRDFDDVDPLPLDPEEE